MGHLFDSIALQLGQGLSGTFADYLALLLACVGIAAALARALHIFSLIKELRFLLNPQALTLSSVALWTNGDLISIHHQHLTMFFFLAAMFLRFSGTSEHPKAAASLHSLITRWFSRLGEYAILAFALPRFQSIARPQYVVPLMIFVATARTNEVFRAWSGPDGGKRSPSEEDHMRKAMEDLVLDRSGISSAPSTGNLHGPPQLEEQEKALFQLGFLWIDGSGTLVIAALTVLMVSIVSMAESLSDLHNSRFLTICVEVLYVITAVYLCLQCLPAWIICMEKFGMLVKDDRIQDQWLGEVKAWTSDMAHFLKAITVSAGFPHKCKDLSTKLGLLFAIIEGMELAPHIVVASFCRILLHSLLLLIAWIVRQLFKLCKILSRMRLINKLLNLLISDSPYDPWVKIRHFLLKFAATICQQELLILKGLFQDSPSFILIGVEFIQRDETSQILFSKRMHGSFRIPGNACSTVVRKIMDGYCWVEPEGRTGYADLEGTFVRVPLKEIGRESSGVVGGWITEGDVKSHEWGDSEYNQDSSENVGHFFANLNYDDLFQGQSAATLKVWLKFGPKAIRISHWWVNDKSILVACTCEPPLQNPNVKVLASHITSWPAMTTCRLSLVHESLI